MWSFGVGKSAGVAFLFSPNFAGKIIHYLHYFDGRILSILVEIDSVNFNLVSHYAHTPQTPFLIIEFSLKISTPSFCLKDLWF